MKGYGSCALIITTSDFWGPQIRFYTYLLLTRHGSKTSRAVPLLGQDVKTCRNICYHFRLLWLLILSELLYIYFYIFLHFFFLLDPDSPFPYPKISSDIRTLHSSCSHVSLSIHCKQFHWKLVKSFCLPYKYVTRYSCTINWCVI